MLSPIRFQRNGQRRDGNFLAPNEGWSHGLSKACIRLKPMSHGMDTVTGFFIRLTNIENTAWKQFVEAADEKTIWTIKKYMNSKPTQHYIPTINGTATTNEEKANQFREVLSAISSLPPADTSDITAT